jgi:hypothetical protein
MADPALSFREGSEADQLLIPIIMISQSRPLLLNTICPNREVNKWEMPGQTTVNKG